MSLQHTVKVLLRMCVDGLLRTALASYSRLCSCRKSFVVYLHMRRDPTARALSFVVFNFWASTDNGIPARATGFAGTPSIPAYMLFARFQPIPAVHRGELEVGALHSPWSGAVSTGLVVRVARGVLGGPHALVRGHDFYSRTLYYARTRSLQCLAICDWSCQPKLSYGSLVLYRNHLMLLYMRLELDDLCQQSQACLLYSDVLRQTIPEAITRR